MAEENNNKRFLPGVILILIGSVFLLDRMGIIPDFFVDFFFDWPGGWLISIGIILLVINPQKPTGIIMILIGAIFVVPEVLHLPYNIWDLWPAILIAVGVLFIIRGRSGHKVPVRGVGDTSLDVLNDTSVFGGGDILVTSDNFQGGRVTYIFGGSNINLLKSDITSGKAVIDVFCMFGGTTFLVPSDWNVRVEVVPIFGGFSDSRKPTADTVIDKSKELVIKGTVLFGGGEVKSF